MKAKPVTIFLLCASLAAFLLGFSGTTKLARTGGQPAGADQLIGMLITRKPLDFEDGSSSSGSRPSPYQTDAARNYEFENVQGIRFFVPLRQDQNGSYWDTVADRAVTEENLEIQVSDLGESLTLEGTLYLSARQNPGNFYFYPVYQTAGGEAYAAPGDGVQPVTEQEAGSAARYEIRQTRSVTNAGSTSEAGSNFLSGAGSNSPSGVNSSSQLENRILIRLCYLDEPAGLTLLQFDGEHRLLSQAEWKPGELPESLAPLPETQYLIAETISLSPDQSETVSRRLYDPEEETLSAFYAQEDGICIRQECQINWKQGEETLSLSYES